MFSSVFAFNPAVDDNASNVMINEPGLMAAMFNNDPTLFDQNTVFTLANNNASNLGRIGGPQNPRSSQQN